jgi:serine/threonine-protein kinase PpkA
VDTGSQNSRRFRRVEIPGYEIECEIGRGGMAVVYRAVQQTLNRQVAIKVLTQDADDDQDFVQRFEKEGRFLAQMLHTNIITIYDIGVTQENQLFLSVEYLSGGTLKNRIKQGLSSDSAIEITKAIAKALAYTHERGVIHRDIKPSNIMFRQDGTPVLTDFGIARSFESKTVHTMAGLTIGSPGYMSPEQVMGETATIQSDLYGLGVVFYEMLTGRPLYEAGSPMAMMFKHLHDPLPILPKECAYLQPVVHQLIAKKIEDRYKSVAEFLRALNLVVSGDTGSQTKLNMDIHNVSLVEFASSKIRHSFGKKSRLIGITVLAGFIVFLVISAYIFKSTKLSNDDGTLEPVDHVEHPESDQNLRDVATLLQWAESQLQAGHLTHESDQGSAEATYRRVLRLDPGNAQALEGLQNIAGKYEKRAQQRLDAGALQESLDEIHQGLAVVPGHTGLMPLYGEVKRRINEVKAQQAQQEELRQRGLQAEQFMGQAQDRLQEGSLEVGLAYVEQGLLAVPNHPELLTLGVKIKAQMADRQRQAEARQRQAQEAGRKAETVRRQREADEFLASALAAQRKEEYAASLQQIEKGLALAPDHDGLIRLRDRVRGQFATEQQRQAEQAQREQDIKALLEQAEKQLEAKRLTMPTGNNAEETYQQLLKLDPENAQARAGFGRIAQEYERLAQQRREAGALQDSLAQIDKGLAIIPKHEGLLRLRQEISHEWEAEQQQLGQKRQEQEQRKAAQEAEAKRKADAEAANQAKRKAAQEAEARRKAAQDAEVAQRKAAEEAKRKVDAEVAQRKAAEEAKRKAGTEGMGEKPKEPLPEKPPQPETMAKPRVFGTF